MSPALLCPALHCSAATPQGSFTSLRRFCFLFLLNKISREFPAWKRHFRDGAGHSTRKAQEFSSSILPVMLDMDGAEGFLSPFLAAGLLGLVCYLWQQGQDAEAGTANVQGSLLSSLQGREFLLCLSFPPGKA